MTSHISIGHNTAGAGATQINNVINNIGLAGSPTEQETRQACLKALRCPDPFKIKTRLKQTKDELLLGSFAWILSDNQYCQWQDGDDVGLLWIKGGAGTGKTMMSIGLVEELSRRRRRTELVTHFFCQNGDSSLNTVAAILKGLILQLVERRETAYTSLLKRWNIPKACFEEDLDHWQSLWDVLLEILSRCQFDGDTIFLVVDALDECLGNGMVEFLRSVVHTGLFAPQQIKWLFTSRALQRAEDYLLPSANRLHISFELHPERIEQAIRFFIKEQVRKLTFTQKFDDITCHDLVEILYTKANGTFLWVSQVCQKLRHVSPEHAISVVASTTSDLQELYAESFARFSGDSTESGTRCMNLLQMLMLTHRALTVEEVTIILNLPNGEAETELLISDCSQFVTVRHDHSDGSKYVEFVHQSARDYLAELPGCAPSHGAWPYNHETMTSRCMAILEGLHANPFGCPDPSASSREINRLGDRSLTGLKYAAIFWGSHLEAIPTHDSFRSVLCDGSRLHKFLLSRFLEWIEWLSLMDELPRAIETLLVMIRKMGITNDSTIVYHKNTKPAISSPLGRTTHQNTSMLLHLVQDQLRFLTRHFGMIARWPLQVYSSAIIFSPQSSLVRQGNIGRVTDWLQFMVSDSDLDWPALQQTLVGHSRRVRSVAFSPDGQLIASGSDDHTMKLWSVKTGQVQQTLIGHSSWVESVVFSADGQLIASGSDDNTMKLWSVKTGQIQQTLRGHSHSVQSVVFSSDSQLIASSSPDKTVKVWLVKTGHVQQTLIGHSSRVQSVIFSPDGQLIASGSDDHTMKLWSVKTGQVQQTLTGHIDWVCSVVFSPDGQQIASGSRDNTVKLWSVKTGQVQQTLTGHIDWVCSVVFSPDGQQIASGSCDNTVKVWSIKTGQVQQTLTGHSGGVQSVAVSPDGQLIASGSDDNTVKVWSVKTEEAQQTLEGHSGSVASVAFSGDGYLIASGSVDNTVKVWSVKTGHVQQTLRGHLDWVHSVIFSPDGQQIASASGDDTIKLWSVKTGQVQQTLTDDSYAVMSVAFSPDSQQIVSGSHSNTINVWSVKTGQVQQTLRDHSRGVRSVAVSPDGQLIASGSDDNTVKVWSVKTGQVQQTLIGHLKGVRSVAFSADGQLVASSSWDDTVKLWSVFSRPMIRIATSRINSSQDPQLIQTLNCPALNADVVRFAGADNLIITNWGTLLVSNYHIYRDRVPHDPLPQEVRDRYLSCTDHWIRRGSVQLLYIPPEYDLLCSDSQDNMIVLGCKTGQILYFCVHDGFVLSRFLSTDRIATGKHYRKWTRTLLSIIKDAN